MNIIWTEQAELTYLNNIEYLLENWEDSVVTNFIHETERVLSLLATQPNIGRYDPFYKCYRFLVVEQVSIFYMIDPDCIVLKTFWDNRQKPIRNLF